MSTSPTQIAGIHDFSPEVMLKRKYIIHILETQFKQYGFLPMQTPAIEHLDVLTDKYGDEGEQLLFKILNSGNFLDKVSLQDYQKGYKALLPKITKKGLRYDLTIPLARYIATHRHTLSLPFKRFQIQPVWRAEKPQKNRYREFYQCDIDIIGSNSLICEAEMLTMIGQIANKLTLERVTIALNHRLIFKALSHQINAPEKEITLCRILDKLDKIGQEKVIAMLHKAGFTKSQIQHINWLFAAESSLEEGIQLLKKHLHPHEASRQAIADLEKIHSYLQAMQMSADLIAFTPTLARGLDYYTGTIFEVKVQGTSTSIAGGGRYDQLTTLFGLHPIPSIGLSFGLDRLYQVLEEKKLLPKHILSSTALLLIPLGTKEETPCLLHLKKLREAHIASEIYPAGHRLQKALSYAKKKNIPWVGIVGQEEMQKGLIALKNMTEGFQKSCALGDLIPMVKKNTLYSLAQ
ncbi:MAG: histidine--tRNA ligase [Bacteroidota bacterium]